MDTPLFITAFLGLSPGPLEILVLLAAVLVLFGAKRIPEFARTVGKVMEELRRASQDFKRQLMEVEEEFRSEVEPFIHEPPEHVVNRIQEDENEIDAEYTEADPGDEEDVRKDAAGAEPEKPDTAS